MGILETAVFASHRVKRSLLSNQRIREAYYRAWSRLGYGNFFQHEFMLADSVRMDTYHKAIDRLISSQDQVVDLGTGTGILSLFAARKNPKRIYALDQSQTMIEYAKKVAAANDIHNITFVQGHSSSFHPAEPVDVILHEQMSDSLFQERMIENVLDLRDRVLKKGGRILPAKFEFFLEPVQLQKDKRIPFMHEQVVHGISLSPIPEDPSPTYLHRYIDPSDVEFSLCEPSPIYTCDLTTLTRDSIPTRFSVRKPVTRSGELGGVCSYFRAIFDDDIAFGTGPLDRPRTHWTMDLFRFPTRSYRQGDIFEMSVDVPRLSDHKTWRWELGSTSALNRQDRR